MNNSPVYIVVFFAALASSATAAGWDYSMGTEGPENWSDNYAKCGGNSQSPIDIISENAEMDNLGRFSMVGFDDVTNKMMTATNNGHSLTVSLTGDYSVSGGGLEGSYKTAQFHFHWGSNDTQGSEHQLNGATYPVEMHIVHYSDKYENVSEALPDSSGLAVLGFFFEVSEDDNDAFTTLFEAIGNITNKDDEYIFPSPFTLRSLLPADLTKFYRYQGSLTTPTCDESVVWTVFNQTITLSSSQIARFRMLKKDDVTIQDTFRPVQELYNRRVIYSDSNYTLPDSTTQFPPPPSHSNTIASSLLLNMVSIVFFFYK